MILTAAHCLYEIVEDKPFFLNAKIIWRQKGCNGDKGTVEFTPLADAVPPQYMQSEDPNYDYALILTKEKSDVRMKVANVIDVKKLAGLEVSVAGYPSEHNPLKELHDGE